MSDKRRTFAVIDGNSLMHRAFHAVPPTMNAPDGRPTNAIFGFLNMFLKMIDAFSPDGVVVAFDKGKPRVRMEMLPQYKAQRPPMDPDVIVGGRPVKFDEDDKDAPKEPVKQMFLDILKEQYDVEEEDFLSPRSRSCPPAPPVIWASTAP